MRHLFVRAVLAVLVLTACEDEPTRPTGPVTMRFIDDTLSSGIPIVGELVIDDTLQVSIPGTVFGLPRGPHRFTGRLNIDYLPFDFTATIDPPSSTVTVHPLNLQEASCRVASDQFGRSACLDNVVYWRNHTRLFCPVGDFGELCSAVPDPTALGLTWPDSASARSNVYVTHGKLLIGAIMGAGSAAAQGDTIAMGFYEGGDYSPRVRLHVVSGDSTRWQEEVWTDSRFFPLFPDVVPVLTDTVDRGDVNFGLSVRITTFLPPSQPNAILFRFDIRNISATDSFRFAHPEEPVGGHTLTDVYLLAFFDPNIAGTLQTGETTDDNSTAFPAESLTVSYDQAFEVSGFAAPYNTAPGLVGVQLIAGPPGTTAKAVIASTAVNLSYLGNAAEDRTYAIIAGGRAGTLDTQLCTSSDAALICSTEAANNTRAGWSVGPIPQLAPGDEAFLVVGLLLAPPRAGSFTSGTAVPPQQDRIDDPTRPIYLIAEHLRSLAAQTKTLTVDGAPALR